MADLMLARRGFTDVSLPVDGAKIHAFSSVNVAKGQIALLVLVIAKKVTSDTLKSIMTTKNDMNADIVVIVHAKPITPEAKRAIALAPFIETFTSDEMSFDLLKVVPKHTLVDPTPSKQQSACFPRISDIVTRYMGCSVGDVVAIDEGDGTVSLRRVV